MIEEEEKWRREKKSELINYNLERPNYFKPFSDDFSDIYSA